MFGTSKLLNINDATKRIGNFFKLPIQLFHGVPYPELALLRKYAIHLGAFSLNYGVVASASLHGIETDLDGFTPPDKETSLWNDLWYNIYELTIAQQYKYEQGGWRLSLGCPLNLYTQTLDDHILFDKQDYTRLLVSPNVSVSYEWCDWSGNVNVSY